MAMPHGVAIKNSVINDYFSATKFLADSVILYSVATILGRISYLPVAAECDLMS